MLPSDSRFAPWVNLNIVTHSNGCHRKVLDPVTLITSLVKRPTGTCCCSLNIYIDEISVKSFARMNDKERPEATNAFH